MKELATFSIALLLIFAGCSESINPILTDSYAADPSAIVFGDTLFVYPSHDQPATVST